MQRLTDRIIILMRQQESCNRKEKGSSDDERTDKKSIPNCDCGRIFLFGIANDIILTGLV